MQLMSRGIFYFITLNLIVLVLESSALAKTRFALMMSSMLQTGRGGWQVYDDSRNERLSILAPTLFIESTITPQTTLRLDGTYDTWSGASERAFDAATGASGRAVSETKPAEEEEGDDDNESHGGGSWENRKAVNLSVSHRMSSLVASAAAGYSTESDYRSIHGGLSLARGFAEDNFTLSGSYDHYEDSMLAFDLETSTFSGWTPKRTDSIGIGASQILSPSDLVYFGVGLTSQRGALHGNRNTVSVAGERQIEVLPDRRNKKTFVARGVHGFSDEFAAHLDYRYYLDDWKISAHTIEPSLAVGFDEDAALIRVFYRFHQQSAASMYADRFEAKLPSMTSDSDLAAFKVNEAGIQGSYRFEGVSGFEYLEAGGSLVYYTRSNDLQVGIFQLSVGGAF